MKFVGLGLGLWNWPLINRLMEITQGRGLSAGRLRYSNLEELTIKELPDGSVRMIVHRKAQRE